MKHFIKFVAEPRLNVVDILSVFASASMFQVGVNFVLILVFALIMIVASLMLEDYNDRLKG